MHRNICRAKIDPAEVCWIDTNANIAGNKKINDISEFLTALSDRPAIPVKVMCSLYSTKGRIPYCRVVRNDCTINMKITLNA